MRDPGEPTLRPAVRGAEENLKWDLVGVAHDEVVPDVKRRQRTTKRRINRVHLFYRNLEESSIDLP